MKVRNKAYDEEKGRKTEDVLWYEIKTDVFK
jgi:hypothetical protein